MEFIDNLNQYDYLFKFIILGITDIGKTYLVNRIKFYNDYPKFVGCQKKIGPTFGVEFILLFIKYKAKLIKIHFWDTSGNIHFESNVSYSMRGCKAFLLCYDAYNRDSFEYIRNKYYEIKNKYNNTICAFIRIKYDIKINKDNETIVSDEEALEFADENNIIFGHISSIEKYEAGIIKIFELIIDKVLDIEEKNSK